MKALSILSRRRGLLIPTIAAALFCAAFLVGLAAAPPVRAASGDFIFTGRGWGHGVGMSQWGAWEAAREGVTFDKILAFYYPGTTLTSIADPDTSLKVRISSEPWKSGNTDDYYQVDLRASVTAMTLSKHTSAGDATEEIPAGSFLDVFCSGGKVQVVTSAGSQGPFDYVEVTPKAAEAGTDGNSDGAATEGRISVQLKTSSAAAAIAPREYWGTIRVQPSDVAGKLWVYNFVLLEKYVRSIAEVDYDWATPGAAAYAPEAVKAQAVAARTYAVAKNATLADNQNDQCYRGYTFEVSNPGIAQAAEDTAGQILTYQGKAITAYFSAHSGGYTTTTAWSGTVPAYIVSQPDPWSLEAPPPSQNAAGPGYNWTYTVSPADLSAKVNGHLTDSVTKKTVNVGLIKRIDIIARDTADADSHVKTLGLIGDSGNATVTASSFRALFGYSTMRSTLFLSITGGQDLTPGEFYDVGANHLYHEQIARMVTSGLMGGYDGGLFKPDGSITRWQFAKISVGLYNIMHPENPIPLVDVTTSPYTDVPMKIGTLGDESDWVAAAKNAGLVTGMTSTGFQPYTIMRRDQMAAMMCKALGWEDKAAALPLTTPGFADVPATSPYWAAATYLKEQGILQGYPDPGGSDATFLRVDEAIKREHVAVILCRVLDLAD